MSLIIGIPCKDRIVVASDGRSVDFDTGSQLPDRRKLFALGESTAMLIAGNGLIDDLDTYMESLVLNISNIGNKNITDIARDVKRVIDQREWAEWKDNMSKSHLEVIVAGYDADRPRVYAIMDNRKLVSCWAYAFGNWENSDDYLANSLSPNYLENSAKTANKVAVEMLSHAEDANSKEIGGSSSIWHVYPNRIVQLTTEDISRLKARYC